MLAITKARKDQFLEYARHRFQLSEAKYRSASGADRIDAVLHDLEATAFRKLAEGQDLELTLKFVDEQWKKFADAKNKEVAAAPKMKSGPMSGCSSIHYKWANPNKSDSALISIRIIYKSIMTIETEEKE